MPYQIIIKRSAEKELNALPSALRNRIAKRLLTLEDNPRRQGSRNCKEKKATACGLAIIASC